MEVFEGVGDGVTEGVLLDPVIGMRIRVAVSDGVGVSAKKNRGDFVGVKNSLAKASCVKT